MTEWEQFKEALNRGSASEAADAFARYRQAGGASRPMLVSLGRGTKYPNAIPLDEIPNLLRTNPQFFELLRKVVK